MDNPICSACGSTMKRNGHTSSGATRWRCKGCGASLTHRIDNAAKRLAEFLDWLMGKGAQADLPGEGRTFRRRTSEFWSIWPIAPYTGEVFDVVFLDGLWVGRDAVVLMACTKEHVVAWHLAQSECAEAWAALMMRMPAPVMAVTDGAPGFAKAARAIWPATRIQRCVFHAFCQVRRCTTSRPKLDCGIELYGIARRLLKAKDVTIRVLSALGNLVRIASLLLFALVMLGVFLPSYQIVSDDLFFESLTIVIKIAVVVAGSMVAASLILRYFYNAIARIADRLGINAYSVVGLIASLATCISMIPMLDKMDQRGKVMNAAFAVSGAFVLGGQLAFMASVEPSSVVSAYMAAKLTGGICAVVAAMAFTPKSSALPQQ